HSGGAYANFRRSEKVPLRRHGQQATPGLLDASRRPSSPGRRSFPVGSARVQPIAVAKRYARALADSAGGKDPRRLEAVASELALAAKVLGADVKFARFFADPSISQDDKRAAIDALGRRAKLSEVMRSFLLVLVANRRLGALGAIRDYFEAIADERL